MATVVENYRAECEKIEILVMHTIALRLSVGYNREYQSVNSSAGKSINVRYV